MKRAVSGVVMIMLLTSVLSSAFIIQPARAGSGIINIRPDGIDPPTAPIQRDGDLYTFTDNIYDSILLQRDNTIMDGAGYTVQGPGSFAGIEVNACNVTIKNMRITAFSYGIYINTMGYSVARISGNSITNNGMGICLRLSYGNSISGNSIANNGVGLSLSELWYSSSKFYHNNFSNNVYQVSPHGTSDVWDDGYPSGGNYWSDYTGIDGNGDGIGDTPYTIDMNNQDRYPLVDPWTEPTLGKFKIGDNVETTANLNVRAGPGLSYAIISAVQVGARGHIMAGPVEADGYIWWDVNYDIGIRGWSAESWLELVPPNPGQPTQPHNILPEDGAVDVSIGVELVWSPPLEDVDVDMIPWEWEDYVGFHTHIERQWQVTDIRGDFSNPYIDETRMALILSGMIPEQWDEWVVLEHDVTYYWRVRYLDFRGVWSAWSEETSFTTSAAAYVPPFAFSPERPKSGEVVVFTATNSYALGYFYEWEFGDGVTEVTSEPSVSHRFRGAMVDSTTFAPTNKEYDVRLNLLDQYGNIIDSKPALPVTVEPLTKSMAIDPGWLGVDCSIEATYNWVRKDEATEQDVYIVSRFDSHSLWLCGAYALGVLHRVDPYPARRRLVWSEKQLSLPGSRVHPFAEFNLATYSPLGDGIFMGIEVTETDSMGLLAVGNYPLTSMELVVTQFDPSSLVEHILEPEDMEAVGWYDLLDDLYVFVGWTLSPCELRIYDSYGRVTGLVNGEIREEIPNSMYTNETVVILNPTDTYRYEVVGTEREVYGLRLTFVEDAKISTFAATDIPIAPGAVHLYAIDWAALSLGEEGVTVQIDPDGDATFEYTLASDNTLASGEFLAHSLPDMDGNGMVGIEDIVFVSGRYGSREEEPLWDPKADLAQTYGKIDIFDLVTLAAHYGEETP